MSSKQTVMAIIERLPESVTVPEILKAIAHHPSLSEVIDESYSLDELSEEDWAAFVARGIQDELSDASQDRYEPDYGESVNGAR